MEGSVVTWLHCPRFQPHPALLEEERRAAQIRLNERQKTFRLYEQLRLAKMPRDRELAREQGWETLRGPKPKYQKGRRAVEQIDRDGNRVRLFPNGAPEAIYELGLSAEQIYDRLSGKTNGDLRSGGFIGLRYVQEAGV
jgi:hypothetical protein